MIASIEQQRHERGVQNTIDIAQKIAQNNRTGNIEIRTIKWIPSCSIVVVDPEKDTSTVMVTLYPAYLPTALDKRHHLYLSKKEDNRWYTEYVDQFENLWREGTPMDLGQ